MDPETIDPAPGTGNGLRETTAVVVGVILCCSGLFWLESRPRVNAHQSDAHFRWKARADIAAISEAITRYALDHEGLYPENLGALIEEDAQGFTYLDIDTIPKDPWGTEYVYFPPRPGAQDFRVISLGRDGLLGGEGEDADVEGPRTPDAR
jgi:general secretion pathway protein G